MNVAIIVLIRCFIRLGVVCTLLLSQLAGEQAYQSRNVIALDESRLVVHKDTAVNCYTERFACTMRISQPKLHGGVCRFSHELLLLAKRNLPKLVDCFPLSSIVIHSLLL